MKPKFIDEYGAQCKQAQAGMTNSQRHAYVNAECLKFKNTGHRVHLDNIWQSVIGYLLSLPTKEKSLLKGFAIEEVLGEAFFVMERTVERFNPAFNVPFVLYFRLRLGGHLSMLRARESKYVAVDEVYGGNDPMDEMMDDKDQALWLLSQLECLEETDEMLVTKAYIKCWLDGKQPKGMVLSSYSGLPLKKVSETMPGVPKMVRDLIL